MWTDREIEDFKRYVDTPLLSDKNLVKTRKIHFCMYSGNYIPKGRFAYRVKIFPNETTGRCLDLVSPATLYACGECVDCTH